MTREQLGRGLMFAKRVLGAVSVICVAFAIHAAGSMGGMMANSDLPAAGSKEPSDKQFKSQDISKKLYSQLMANLAPPQHHLSSWNSSSSSFACVVWKDSTLDLVVSKNRIKQGAYTIARAAENARQLCDGQKPEGSDCECQAVDRDGVNVLVVPAWFTQRFTENPNSPSLAKESELKLQRQLRQDASASKAVEKSTEVDAPEAQAANSGVTSESEPTSGTAPTRNTMVLQNLKVKEKVSAPSSTSQPNRNPDPPKIPDGTTKQAMSGAKNVGPARLPAPQGSQSGAGANSCDVKLPEIGRLQCQSVVIQNQDGSAKGKAQVSTLTSHIAEAKITLAPCGDSRVSQYFDYGTSIGRRIAASNAINPLESVSDAAEKLCKQKILTNLPLVN